MSIWQLITNRTPQRRRKKKHALQCHSPSNDPEALGNVSIHQNAAHITDIEASERREVWKRSGSACSVSCKSGGIENFQGTDV